jgi:adenylate cyclase class 2
MGTQGPVEVEIKAPVDDLDRVRQRLEAEDARAIDHRRETDAYFDHPQRSFADTDEALRVRQAGPRVKITYKGPKLDEATKTREEIDLAVEDEERARQVLTALGFELAGRVVKDREVFELSDLTVVLDEVEGLGSFVEIETVVEGDHEQAREAVLVLAEDLGLDERERRSYLEMLLEEKESGAT